MSTSTPNLRVKDVILPVAAIPVLSEKTIFKEALERMSERRLGIACIVDEDGRLAGILTDGDIRRMLLRQQKPIAALFVDDAIIHSNRSPTVVSPTTPLPEAIRTMEEKEVWDLPVTDETGLLVGLLHLHPAIKTILGM